MQSCFELLCCWYFGSLIPIECYISHSFSLSLSQRDEEVRQKEESKRVEEERQRAKRERKERDEKEAAEREMRAKERTSQIDQAKSVITDARTHAETHTNTCSII
jgi:Na+-translocating ferredoxin:NAD+ oxidoreductase RnfC subunit